MEGFVEQPGEKNETELLQSKMLVYMFLMGTLSVDLSSSSISNLLRDFKDLCLLNTRKNQHLKPIPPRNSR